MTETAKQRLYHILERGQPEDPLSQVVDWALILLIVANVAAAAAATVEVRLFHQTTMREYVEFLRDQAVENAFPDDCIERGSGFLPSPPTGSGPSCGSRSR